MDAVGLLTEWISHLITFILLAVVIELILPNGSFQKYIKKTIIQNIIGLILLFVSIYSAFFCIFAKNTKIGST